VSPRLLLDLGPDGALIAALLLGHAAADFVLQSDAMAEGKRRWSRLLMHVAVVIAAQAAALLPFLTPRAALVVLGVGVLHGVVDRVKATAAARHPGARLSPLVADQAAHLVVLAAAWALLRGGAPASFLPPPTPEETATFTRLAVVGAAYAVCWNGAAAFVGGVLARFGLEDLRPGVGGQDAGPSRGRAIGILERMLALTLVLVDRWGGLGLLLAAKSIARFRDLDDRNMSEHYLIGTLASLLCAVVAGIGVRLLV
jgi:hypothetical protein